MIKLCPLAMLSLPIEDHIELRRDIDASIEADELEGPRESFELIKDAVNAMECIEERCALWCSTEDVTSETMEGCALRTAAVALAWIANYGAGA